jgi:hypothetical protein
LIGLHRRRFISEGWRDARDKRKGREGTGNHYEADGAADTTNVHGSGPDYAGYWRTVPSLPP